MTPHYVYIAGPLSDLPPEYLANVARMTVLSRELIEDGYTPINPAADLLEGIVRLTPLPLAEYQRRSMDLLRLLAGRRDSCMYVTRLQHSDGRESKGVRAEIEEATRLGIPVVRSHEQLRAWSRPVKS